MPLILVLLLVASFGVTHLFYLIIKKLFRNVTIEHLSRGQQVLFIVVMLYVPAQLILLLSIGHYLPIGRIEDHIITTLIFAIAHILLGTMGAVASKKAMPKKGIAIIPFIANFCAAFFYTLSTIILVMWSNISTGDGVWSV